MAVRHVLLTVVVALGVAGCTSAVAGQAVPAVHPVLRFRAVMVDLASQQPMILPVTPPSTSGQPTTSNTAKPSASAPPSSPTSSPATSTSPLPQGAPAPGTTGVTDPYQAKALRQNPALVDDPIVQQAALAATDCARPDPLHAADDPALPLVTCDKDGQYKYILGPSFLDGTAIRSASASYDQQQAQWIVTLDFKPDGAKTWADYTGKNVGQQAAFTLDGQVQSAPKINQQIIGNTEITGNFTEQSARDLAASLNNH